MTGLLLAIVLMFSHSDPDSPTSSLRSLVIPGERLSYSMTSAHFGKIGRASMNTTLVEGVLRITFDSNAKILLFKASDHTVSDLDPERLTTLRYTKRERSPIGRRDENVTIDQAGHTWSDGTNSHPLASNEPLDELSFINLVRSLVLVRGEELVVRRHFDAARNPVRIRLLNAPADSVVNYTVVDVVEMRVPDKRQDSGISVLRFYLTRDGRRLPLRIESTMPIAGRIRMDLE